VKSAPIALFTYARPDHLRRTVEALLGNPPAADHDLIIFSDAARSYENQSAVDEVRNYLTTIKGFRSITIHHRPNNFGLARSIIDGVTQVLSAHERIIVLEDDLVTSQHFLAYMNSALNFYADDQRVISVHGWVFQCKDTLPEIFFLPGADCWGWATWRRGWSYFRSDGKALLGELKRREMIKAFDFNGAYGFSKLLEDQIRGANDSWAIRWYASAFLAGKLTLYPGRSLVHNIGNDSSGTHSGENSNYDVEVSRTPICLSAVEVSPSALGLAAFEAFFRSSRGTIAQRLRRRLTRFFKARVSKG